MINFDTKQLAKIEKMKANGIDPYPSGNRITDDLKYISYDRELSYSNILEFEELTVLGRLRFKNELGSIGFGRIEDEYGHIQFCIQKNKVDESSFLIWKSLDLGDIVYITGNFGRTRSGELTIFVSGLSLASKCISPMPDKVSGIADVETEYRMRYLHLAVSQEARTVFANRSKIVSGIRRFFEDSYYMEVETPMLHPIPGGALAKPFVTHHNSLDQDMYLRIAPELYLKRLLVGGYQKIFEMNRSFRNEGIGKKYNPEFTSLELYSAGSNYNDLIELIRKLLVNLKNISPDDNPVNFLDIRIVRFDDLLKEIGISDPWNISELEDFWSSTCMAASNIPNTISGWFQLIFDKLIQHTLINPTFIINHPAEMSPLARRSDDDKRTVDRFELYIRGMEIADGWTELNDPIEQLNNFNEQAKSRANGNEEAMHLDEDFIRALTYGMPPAAGFGIGIDRLVMVLLNKYNIRDVILFPTLKSEQGSV